MPTMTLSPEGVAMALARRPAKGAVLWFDAEVQGLVLEVRASGGATYYYRYREDGKVRMCRIGGMEEVSFEAARQEARRLAGMRQAGQRPAQAVRRSVTLERFVVESYLPHARATKRSADTDETLLRRHVLPELGGRPLEGVRAEDVARIRHGMLAAGYAPGTCNRMLALLRYVFNCALRWGAMAGGNPAAGIKPLEDHGARERYLSREEVERLLQVLERPRYRLVGRVVRLLLLTGCRKREVLDVRWEEIDWQRRLLTIPAQRSKSKRPHVVPLSEAALAVLEEARAERREGVPWVFVNPRTGKPPVSIFCAWDSIRRQAGLPEVRLHDLRHSFASFLVNAGRSLYEVQRLLGHHDPKVTMRYAHLAPEPLQEAVEVVGGVVSRRENIYRFQ